MIEITLKWRMLSTNHIYGQTKFGRYLKPNARALKESYIKQLKQQHWDRQPIQWDLNVVIWLYRYGKEPDIDNVHKLSLDAMNGIVYLDDTQIKTMEIYKRWKDNKNPRIEFTIFQITNGNW